MPLRTAFEVSSSKGRRLFASQARVSKLRSHAQRHKQTIQTRARIITGRVVLSGVPYSLVTSLLFGKLAYDLLDRNMDDELFGWENIAVALGATAIPEAQSTKLQQRRPKRAVLQHVTAETESESRMFYQRAWTWVQFVGPVGVALGVHGGYLASVVFEKAGPAEVARVLQSHPASLGMLFRYTFFVPGAYIGAKVAYVVGNLYLGMFHDGAPLKAFLKTLADGTKFEG